MKQVRKFWFTAVSIIAWAALPAFAQTPTAAPTTPSEPAAPAQTSTSPLLQKIRENAVGSYTMWITGSSIEAMDGVKDGGSNLSLDQFFKVGYKVSKKWTISVTQPWTNKVRHESAGQRNLTWQNPYITASNSSITKSDKYGTNLSGLLRYYMPFAHSAADNVGKQTDAKYGVLRGVLIPSKTFFDGRMTVSGDLYVQRYFAGSRPDPADKKTLRQRDWRIYLYPHVSYDVTQKFSPYVAYFNDLEHYRNDKERGNGGHWRKFNEKHLIEVGFNWTPVKGLNVNPYLEYGPKFVPKKSTVGLIVDYAFL